MVSTHESKHLFKYKNLVPVHDKQFKSDEHFTQGAIHGAHTFTLLESVDLK